MYKLPIVCCLLVFLGCSQKKEHAAAFYYWKTIFKITDSEKQALSALHTKDLYIRFFDVDTVNDSLVPVGPLSGLDSVPENLQIIPVVFITNRSFLHTSPGAVRLLANRVYEKIGSMWPEARKPYDEMQIDCDWSESTKANYFLFLKELKEKLKGKTLSATIRLHQVKYPIRSGIPPVDKGMLMFYNMGNAKEINSQNSIYNRQDAQKYAGYISGYPLSLDLALPIFSWQLQFRDRKLTGIVSKDDCPDTTDNNRIIKTTDHGLFEIKSSFLHEGRYFVEGDLLKTERMNETDLKDAALLLSENKQENTKRKIVFFDLDEYNLTSISYETIEEIMDILD